MLDEPEYLKNLTNEEAEIVFLGTGAAIPNKIRSGMSSSPSCSPLSSPLVLLSHLRGPLSLVTISPFSLRVAYDSRSDSYIHQLLFQRRVSEIEGEGEEEGE